jgi:hypothetical protein
MGEQDRNMTSTATQCLAMNFHDAKRRRSSTSPNDLEPPSKRPESESQILSPGLVGIRELHDEIGTKHLNGLDDFEANHLHHSSSSIRRRPILIPDLRNHALTPALKRPQTQRTRAVESLVERGFPYSRSAISNYKVWVHPLRLC